jgi:uncharacterized protein (TIGR00255 family)
MSGFAQERMSTELGEMLVELRTVNNKYLKLSVKLPDAFSALTPQVEQRLRDAVTRGTVDCTVRARLEKAPGKYRVDRAALEDYCREAAEVRQSLGLDSHVAVEQLMTLPGVLVEAPPERLSPEHEAAFFDLLDRCIEALQASRRRDGKAHHDRFASDVAAMRTLLDKARTLAEESVSGYAEKLTARVNKLLESQEVELSGEQIAREVAVYADRSDVGEEMTRFGAHLDELDRFLESDEPVGRRLEVLLQELLREANTMASKAATEPLHRTALDLKVMVDTLREHALNIE